MYVMYAGIYDKTISINFYQNLFIKVKVAWKNSRRFWAVLGLNEFAWKLPKYTQLVTTENPL